MIESKFDLSANKFTIDYEALIKVARIAMRYSFLALDAKLHRWYDPEPRIPILDIQGMVNDAESLGEATTAYHYLVEGRNRRKVTLESRLKKEK